MDYDILYGIELGIRCFDFRLVFVKIKTNALFQQDFLATDWVCGQCFNQEQASVIFDRGGKGLDRLNKDEGVCLRMDVFLMFFHSQVA